MSRHWTEPVSKGTLETRVRYFVEVCRFTFRFQSLEEIRRYLEFFRLKVRPSSRLVVRDIVKKQMQDIAKNARARGERISKPYGHRASDRRWWLRQFIRAEHDTVQTPFERLPMYLLKDKNRLRVVRALETALSEFA